MFKRNLETEIVSMAKAFPVVTIMGPRQSGKTTLVKHIFSHKPHVNLEDIEVRRLAEVDPRAFIEKYRQGGAIFDEIQRVPHLLSYIQVTVDEDQIDGQFILTGSHQLALHEAISQSLAGRTAILKLWPLSLKEMQANQFETLSLDQYLLSGGFPRVFLKGIDAYKFYNNYCQTYLERDVRQMINVPDLSLFQRFMKLCAARVGSSANASELAGELGISSPTVAKWLSLLEASYLIFTIPPYFENFGKRAIKTPRFYFTDVGLACYLLGIETQAQVERDPLRGKLVENLVASEIAKARLNQGREPQLYFFRDQNQNEVDLIFQKGHEALPIEIKSSQTFNPQFLKGLRAFSKLAKERVFGGYLIYAGKEEQKIEQFTLLNYQHAYRCVDMGVTSKALS